MPQDYGQPPGQLDAIFRGIDEQIRQLTTRADNVDNLIRPYHADRISGFDDGGNPTVFNVLTRRDGAWAGITAGTSAWTFKLYNTTQGENGQIQVNGNDNLVAQLNGFIANVNGIPNNEQTGSPPAYPQLSITGNGYVYAYCTLDGSGNITEIDIYYEGSAQTPLTDGLTYAWVLLGTISNYSSSGSSVTFDLANAQNTGYSQFRVCGGGYDVW
jgi:hypothetical protein